MMPAAKNMDPVLGVDIHLIQPPGTVPPVPVPHPFVGMLMDPFDFVPVVGATVMINGMPRAIAGTAGMGIPPHIPIGGVFVRPPASECEQFMGSSTVAVDGDAMAYMALPVLSCQDVGMLPPPRMNPKKKSKLKSLVLPTSVVLPIPMGLPVLIGGPPTISLMALGMRAGMATLGKGFRKLRRLKKGRKKKPRRPKKSDNGCRGNGGEPVNIVTGEQFDYFLDAADEPASLFRWERYYSTAHRNVDRGLGYGFSHCWDHRLLCGTHTWRYVDWTGREIWFDPPTADEPEAWAHGYTLRRIDGRHTELHHGDAPVLVFERTADGDEAVLRYVRRADRLLTLVYEPNAGGVRLTRLSERLPSGQTVDYGLHYDRSGRILGVRRNRAKRLAGYAYDAQGCLVASRDALGGQHVYHYDAHRLMARKRDPRGYTFWWTYDEQGRCLEASGEDGLWWSRFSYHPDERETHVTEREGGTYIYRYDENQTLREVEDPYGGVFTRETGAVGEVIREVDSGGRELRWLYDETGRHVARVDALGNLYPPEPEMPRLPDPMEPQAPATALAWACGGLQRHLVEPTDRGSESMLAVLPPSAREVARSALHLDAPTERGTPQARYDGLGRCIERVDAAGRQEAWRYDAAGNVVAYRDPDGREYRTQVTSWNLPGADVDPLGRTTRYDYTSTEQVRRVVDAGGTVTEYVYDEKDRLLEVRRDGGLRDRYRYDPGDCLVEKRSASGDVLLEMTYDERCLLAECRLASGEVQRFAYDPGGHPILASTQTHDVRIDRDARGNVRADLVDDVGIERFRGPEAGTLVERLRLLGRFTCRYEDGEVPGTIRMTDPTGAVHEVRVSPTGFVVRRHPGALRHLSRYDDGGRLLGQVVDARSNGTTAVRSRSYTYSKAGDLLGLQDSLFGAVAYEVDAAHRLVGMRTARGVHRYRYDAAGNVIGKPGLDGVRMQGNRVQQANRARYRYDERQHVAEVQAADGRCTRYTYDSLDMLVRIEDGHADGPWTAAYDGLGRRLACGRGDAQTRFYWDGDRLAARIQPDGRVRLYLYPDAQARVPWLLVDYDDLEAPPSSGRVYVLCTDQVGCPLEVHDLQGRVVWRAVHVDPYGSVDVDPSSEIEVHLRWPGHYFDADTGLHYNRFRYYDPVLGRYLQTDPLGLAGGLNPYAYAPNPVVQVDLLGLRHSGRTDASASSSGSPRPTAEKPVRTEVGTSGTFTDGGRMPEGTVKVDYGDSKYHLDKKGRIIKAEGDLDPPATYIKEGVSDMDAPAGYIKGTDHRGHLRPERGAPDQATANVPENVIPEHGRKSNLSKKKSWENKVIREAQDNPDSRFRTIHEPIYERDNVRPSEVKHMLERDGVIDPDFTEVIPNPTS